VNKRNIIVSIDGKLVGFWLSVAKLLSNKYNIVITTSNSFSKGIVDNVIPGVSSNIEVKEDFFNELVRRDMSKEEIIRQAELVEVKYGVTCSMLIAHQRGIGKGYIFNVDRHPDMLKSWWPHEKKLLEVLKLIYFWEYIMGKYKPVLFLTGLHNKELSIITRYNKTKYLSLGVVRYGSRVMWLDNEYWLNFDFIKKVKENVKKYSILNNNESINYELDTNAKFVNSNVSFTFTDALKKSLLRLPGEIERFVTGYHNKTQGYKFLQWYSPMLRKPFMYKYFLKYGKKMEDLKGYKLYFFPMHTEPEISILNLSPEFNNSMELIAWLSKSIPANGIIVIKEHPMSYGVRSKHYYDRFRKMGNVVLAHPEISSLEWIRNSVLVSTITGTAGIEAVYYEKPVLAFGKYNIINNLPTVRYANNFDSTNHAVHELIKLSSNKKLMNISKQALYHAQMDVSFEMPGLEKLHKSNTLSMDLAMITVKSLKEKYNI
jgi:hypothetical protein